MKYNISYYRKLKKTVHPHPVAVAAIYLSLK